MKQGLILAAILFTSILHAQTIVYRSIYSKALKDTIHYRVWLPQNFDKSAKHTTIYTVEDTEDGILSGCVMYAAKNRDIPNTIVVGIIKGRMYIDFNFLTGKPNPKGDVFLKEFTTQLISNVEKEFGASVYKAFMGHSYSAVYGNYLMLNHPGLFKGYILFAPERYWNDETNPVYSISDTLKAFYDNHKTFVYLAVGEDDIERRKHYVKEISQKIKIIDSTSLIFKSEIIPHADHMSIIPKKMDVALEHIFSATNNFQQMDSVPNALEYFNTVQKNMNSVFGLDIPKDPQTSWYFYGLAAKNRDENASKIFITYFPFQNVPGGMGLDFCNIASIYLKNGWTDKSKELYLKAIEVSKADEKIANKNQNDVNIAWASRELAFKIYTNDTRKGWDILTKATTTKKIAPYFNIGRFAVDKKTNLKEGLSYLEKCLEMKEDEDFADYQERIYQYLSECYSLRNDKKKAVDFAKQTLSINTNNEMAKKVLAKSSK